VEKLAQNHAFSISR